MGFLPPVADLAKMLDVAKISNQDLALVIGPKSGYISAILSHLVRSVVTLAENDAIASKTQKILSKTGYDLVSVATAVTRKMVTQKKHL